MPHPTCCTDRQKRTNLSWNLSCTPDSSLKTGKAFRWDILDCQCRQYCQPVPALPGRCCWLWLSLRGMRPDTTRDALSIGCAWFCPSLRSRKPHDFPVLGVTGVSVHGLRPYRFRAAQWLPQKVQMSSPSIPYAGSLRSCLAIWVSIVCARQTQGRQSLFVRHFGLPACARPMLATLEF